MVAARQDVDVLRDLTRGGLAASRYELASTAGVGIEYRETSLPAPPGVEAACGFLGLGSVERSPRSAVTSTPWGIMNRSASPVQAEREEKGHGLLRLATRRRPTGVAHAGTAASGAEG